MKGPNRKLYSQIRSTSAGWVPQSHKPPWTAWSIVYSVTVHKFISAPYSSRRYLQNETFLLFRPLSLCRPIGVTSGAHLTNFAFVSARRRPSLTESPEKWRNTVASIVTRANDLAAARVEPYHDWEWCSASNPKVKCSMFICYLSPRWCKTSETYLQNDQAARSGWVTNSKILRG